MQLRLKGDQLLHIDILNTQIDKILDEIKRKTVKILSY